MIRRRALLASSAAAMASHSVAQRQVGDATGRSVAVPDRVAKVFPAGPPAAILLYTLAPELLAGWPARPPRPNEAAFMDPAAAALPEIGRLTGRDNTANLEAVLAARPDLVLDYGSVAPVYVQLAERVAAQTGIPTLLLDGTLAKIPETYIQLGAILGREREGAERAAAAETILAEAREAATRLAARGRPRVFYARGPRGSETGLRGSITTEIIEFAGAENVAVGPPGARGLAPVSVEQVLAWDPDWIVTLDPAFVRHAQADPLWRAARAVRQGRIVQAPNLPFGWVDSPPAVNRLLGLMWLPALFGVATAETLPARVEAFHRLFYHRVPTEAQVKELLASAFPRG
jgi:iron complex transport system substrate-binding protein